jgi:Leucine-rich repeat (LRR) protein
LCASLTPRLFNILFHSRLQLNENKLEGQIPKELGELIDLLHLDLSDNDLGGELPQELNELSKLQTLRINKCRGDLSGNLMTFDRLEDIEELELYSNLFSGSIPSGFLSGKISKSDRIRVRLNGNQLDGAIPADLAEFTNMELDLEDNSISALPQVLCENHDEWMSDEVGLVDGGCDAILCRPGFWSPHGKAVSRLDVTCTSCEANKFFGETTCETTGAVRSREAEILDNLFAATGGRYWSQIHTNWTKPSIPICYREGVKCGEASDDMNSGVTELRLNSFGLRGKIPGEIFELPSILAMDFSHNPVGIELFGVGKSETLQVLLLSETDLRNLAGIENAPARLYEFHAAKNQMVGRFPSQLLQLSNLRNLLLNDNILTGTIPTEVAGMSALRELGIWDNLMHGSFPTELGQLTDLMELEAQNNFFSGLLPKELGNLSKLEHIDVSKQLGDNKLTGPLFDFATNPRLSSVNLSENSFAGTIPTDFLSAASETALLTVDLSDNQLSGAMPIELQSFAQLDIRLKGNMIDSIPEALCDIAGWMGGLAGETEFCNAIMCPPGKFAAEGRQTNPDIKCQDCNNIEEAPYFGSTSCAKVDDIERTGEFTSSQRPTVPIVPLVSLYISCLNTVLLEFYKDMDGRHWAFQDKWLSDESVCTWYGIECNANSSVVAIRLKNNKLVNTRTNGDHSTSLFNLPNLEIVDLQADNNLGLDLRNIPLDSQLKVLILSSTGLKSLEGVNRAKKLQTLRIGLNLLSGSFPSEVLEMTTLRELHLSFNPIVGTIPEGLAALTNLEKLYLSHNDLSGTIPSEIAALSELREVSFSENLLSGSIPKEVSRLPFLTKFEANHQRGKELITGPVPDLAGVPNLV